MTKQELLNLADQLNMNELINNEINNTQVGFYLEATDEVPELEAYHPNENDSSATPCKVTREFLGDIYLYKIVTPWKF